MSVLAAGALAGSEALLASLREAVPGCALLSDPAGMAGYLSDWRGLYSGPALCVARPACTGQVAALMRFALARGIALVPQGGNTGLAGGAVPSQLLRGRPQIVLSLSRMQAIRRIDRVGMTLEAEAGCILQTAKEAALAQGRLLPVSFAAEGSATIGGMIATNAGGINALRYGTVRQQVLGLEAVMADGSVLSGLGALRKDNAGYDWRQWLIGSEGTLGIVTAAVLRLSPLPSERQVAFISLTSPQAALQLLERCQDTLGQTISAFELMSGDSVARVVQHMGGRLPVAAAPWYVLMEVADHGREPLADRVAMLLSEAAEAGEIDDAALADSLDQARRIWALREQITEAERHAGRSLKHDIAVAVSDMPAFLSRATAAVATLDARLQINAFGHLGDGNIHFNVILPEGFGPPPQAIHAAVHDIAMALNGSIAAEHGIGQSRIDELQRLKPAAELQLMRRLKRALDPQGLLNPGKLLPPDDFSDQPAT